MQGFSLHYNNVTYKVTFTVKKMQVHTCILYIVSHLKERVCLFIVYLRFWQTVGYVYFAHFMGNEP